MSPPSLAADSAYPSILTRLYSSERPKIHSLLPPVEEELKGEKYQAPLTDHQNRGRGDQFKILSDVSFCFEWNYIAFFFDFDSEFEILYLTWVLELKDLFES
ncbi:unnamed protein product [Linum tenue]|uniref:Uncharacterized protein n=1 Tax=Linum tenue TaxID=586396 RepID=A0AAV0RPJ7_9ROSI|nr:unnamed protein product [Linum tenue]